MEYSIIDACRDEMEARSKLVFYDADKRRYNSMITVKCTNDLFFACCSEEVGYINSNTRFSREVRPLKPGPAGSLLAGVAAPGRCESCYLRGRCARRVRG